jgi:raffinose/stachyose/melibiose transport system substrate-binding protein
MLRTWKIVSLLLAVLIAVSVIGCKKDDRLTLRVLYYLEATAPNAISDANKWQADFEAANPDIRVERENLFDEAFHDKLRAYVAAGDLPDAIYAWPTTRMDYAYSPTRIFKELLPFMQRDGLTSQYAAFAFDGSQQPGGKVDVFTQGITTTHVMWINMDVLNAVGLQPARTYAELVAQVPVLRAAGKQTIILPAQSDWVHNSCIFSMILGRFAGADWFDRISSGRAKYTDPDIVAAFDFYRQIYVDGVIQRANLGIEYGEGPGMFATGGSAYYIDGDWRVGAFITDSDTGQALISPSAQNNIRLGNFPEIPGAKMNNSNSAILGTGWAMAGSLPAGSAREEAAWKWVKYMLSKDVSQLRVERGGTPVPSNTNLDWNAMQLEPMQKAIGVFGSTYSVVTPVIDGVLTSGVNDALNIGLVQLALGERTGAQVGADVQRVHDAENR